MKIVNCTQGTDLWHSMRCGRPTGSEFGRIITPKKGDYAAGAGSYAAELIAATLGWYKSFQGNSDTERGHRLEKEAGRWLNLRYGIKIQEVGFCLSDCGRYGASPDALCIDGITPVEIKCPDLHTLIKWKIDGELPIEHKAQCHGEMFVTGADRCIFLAYSDHEALDSMMVEVKRDAFTEKLGECVLKFCDELDRLRNELLGEEAEFYLPKMPPADTIKGGIAA